MMKTYFPVALRAADAVWYVGKSPNISVPPERDHFSYPDRGVIPVAGTDSVTLRG